MRRLKEERKGRKRDERETEGRKEGRKEGRNVGQNRKVSIKYIFKRGKRRLGNLRGFFGYRCPFNIFFQ